MKAFSLVWLMTEAFDIVDKSNLLMVTITVHAPYFHLYTLLTIFTVINEDSCLKFVNDTFVTKPPFRFL